eukprot:CAMPEP_0113669232 /NCGR_PEP_ID=MMETSP0038_2-20120614/4457_1 /TAXON_ID=2898 /ORGANISM="Cryptomonas paramecium" /LENGTH=189 /DNA_ID=CAMNT_0000585095 /DNA_START=143 /DNA_END=711 /DNA_ORIENTATION=+ /assembly_acc=CAM_ASM_000170
MLHKEELLLLPADEGRVMEARRPLTVPLSRQRQAAVLRAAIQRARVTAEGAARTNVRERAAEPRGRRSMHAMPRVQPGREFSSLLSSFLVLAHGSVAREVNLDLEYVSPVRVRRRSPHASLGRPPCVFGRGIWQPDLQCAQRAGAGVSVTLSAVINKLSAGVENEVPSHPSSIPAAAFLKGSAQDGFLG